MLIRRTVDRLGFDAMPTRLKCGEAHDWLEYHGANLRFRASNVGDRREPDAEPDPDQTSGDDREAEA